MCLSTSTTHNLITHAFSQIICFMIMKKKNTFETIISFGLTKITSTIVIAWVIHVNWPESHKTVRKDRWTHAYGQQPNIPKIRDMGFSRLTFEVERFTVNKVENQVPYFFIPTCDRGWLLFQYLSNIQFQYSAQLERVSVLLSQFT